jgi:hypothetical protein
MRTIKLQDYIDTSIHLTWDPFYLRFSSDRVLRDIIICGWAWKHKRNGPWTWDMNQVVEHLPGKHKALRSNHSTAKSNDLYTILMEILKNAMQDWRYGSRGRAPAWQVQSQEFKL